MNGIEAPAAQAEVSIFRTVQQRARLLAIYEDKLRQYPVPHETFFVSTRYARPTSSPVTWQRHHSCCSTPPPSPGSRRVT